LTGNAAIEAVDAGTRTTEKSATEIEGKVFKTFRDAAEFAKREQGWVIVRAGDSQGFRVLRKVASMTRSSPRRNTGARPKRKR
jgi:hypothetical protein